MSASQEDLKRLQQLEADVSAIRNDQMRILERLSHLELNSMQYQDQFDAYQSSMDLTSYTKSLKGTNANGARNHSKGQMSSVPLPSQAPAQSSAGAHQMVISSIYQKDSGAASTDKPHHANGTNKDGNLDSGKKTSGAGGGGVSSTGGPSSKKKQKNDFVLDREMIFPSMNQGGNSGSNAISYTLGGKLKRKISMLKEKFEFDISDLQNQIATVKLSQKHTFDSYQTCLNQALQARDEELLKFEKATNQVMLDLKNWVLRKFRLGIQPSPMQEYYQDASHYQQQHQQASQQKQSMQHVNPNGTFYERAQKLRTSSHQAKMSATQSSSAFKVGSTAALENETAVQKQQPLSQLEASAETSTAYQVANNSMAADMNQDLADSTKPQLSQQRDYKSLPIDSAANSVVEPQDAMQQASQQRNQLLNSQNQSMASTDQTSGLMPVTGSVQLPSMESANAIEQAMLIQHQMQQTQKIEQSTMSLTLQGKQPASFIPIQKGSGSISPSSQLQQQLVGKMLSSQQLKHRHKILQSLHQQHMGSKFQTQHMQGQGSKSVIGDPQGSFGGKASQLQANNRIIEPNQRQSFKKTVQKNPVLQPAYSQKLLNCAPRFSLVGGTAGLRSLQNDSSTIPLNIKPQQPPNNRHIKFSPDQTPRKPAFALKKQNHSISKNQMTYKTQPTLKDSTGYNVAAMQQQSAKTRIQLLTEADIMAQQSPEVTEGLIRNYYQSAQQNELASGGGVISKRQIQSLQQSLMVGDNGKVTTSSLDFQEAQKKGANVGRNSLNSSLLPQLNSSHKRSQERYATDGGNNV